MRIRTVIKASSDVTHEPDLPLFFGAFYPWPGPQIDVLDIARDDYQTDVPGKFQIAAALTVDLLRSARPNPRWRLYVIFCDVGWSECTKRFLYLDFWKTVVFERKTVPHWIDATGLAGLWLHDKQARRGGVARVADTRRAMCEALERVRRSDYYRAVAIWTSEEMHRFKGEQVVMLMRTVARYPADRKDESEPDSVRRLLPVCAERGWLHIRPWGHFDDPSAGVSLIGTSEIVQTYCEHVTEGELPEECGPDFGK